jgi:hypothetical protein
MSTIAALLPWSTQLPILVYQSQIVAHCRYLFDYSCPGSLNPPLSFDRFASPYYTSTSLIPPVSPHYLPNAVLKGIAVAIGSINMSFNSCAS